jgi:zinc and cadmium transporter
MTHLLSPAGLAAIVSVLLVSGASLIGVIFLSLSEGILKKLLLPFVSFATGAMLGNVFAHLLPEALAEAGDPSHALLLVLAGMLLSFIIEKVIHWHHCHHLGCEHHARPAGKMILLGDGVHNFLDGMLIAAAYLIDIRIGVATTIAVVLHEIPQEIGDFSVLVHSGYTVRRALLLNLVSALTSVAGAIIVLVLSVPVEGAELVLLPIAAGNFLYIAGSDLIPELHKEYRPMQGIAQLVLVLAGIVLMVALARGSDPHDQQGASTPPRLDAVHESR